MNIHSFNFHDDGIFNIKRYIALGRLDDFYCDLHMDLNCLSGCCTGRYV